MDFPHFDRKDQQRAKTVHYINELGKRPRDRTSSEQAGIYT